MTRQSITLALSAGLAALMSTGACSGAFAESNTFEGRLYAYQGAYQRGQQARAQFEKFGVALNQEPACVDAWTTSGTRDEGYTVLDDEERSRDNVSRENSRYQALRLRSFLNGCMGRPNDLNLTPSSRPASAPVSASASAS
jgi:hypothetical protein